MLIKSRKQEGGEEGEGEEGEEVKRCNLSCISCNLTHLTLIRPVQFIIYLNDDYSRSRFNVIYHDT